LFQAVNFARCPVQHQLLAVNVFTLFDAAFMSWARHEDDWYLHLQAAFTGRPMPAAPAAGPATKPAPHRPSTAKRSSGSSSSSSGSS
jgi:hypothetical protein